MRIGGKLRRYRRRGGSRNKIRPSPPQRLQDDDARETWVE